MRPFSRAEAPSSISTSYIGAADLAAVFGGRFGRAAATSAPAARAPASRGPPPRSWPRDVSTRVIPRVQAPYSLGEDIFALPLGALNGVLSCLKLGDTRQLRLVCRDAEAHVAAYKWDDTTTPVRNLLHWRAAFPRAVSLRLHPGVTAPEWRLLTGLHTLALGTLTLSEPNPHYWSYSLNSSDEGRSVGSCDLKQLRRAGLDAALADIQHVDLRGLPAAPLINLYLDAAAPAKLRGAAEAALVVFERYDVAPGDEEQLLAALYKRSLTVEQAVTLCRAAVHDDRRSPFYLSALHEEGLEGRDVVVALLRILHRFPANAAVQEAGLRALANFTPSLIEQEAIEMESVDLPSDAESYATDLGEYIQEIHGGVAYMRPQPVPVVEEGTVEAAMAALGAHGAASPGVTAAAANVLENAARTSAGDANTAVAAGALPTLLTSLDTHLGVPATTADVLRALAALVGAWEANKAAFLAESGLSRVLAAARTMLSIRPLSADTLVAALKLLQTVVANASPRKAALVEAGGLEVLASALAASVGDNSVMTAAAALVSALAQGAQQHHPQLLAAGVLPPLLTAAATLRGFDDDKALKAVCDALAALAASETGAAAIEGAGGLRILLDALGDRKLYGDTQAAALSAVLAIAGDVPARLEAVAASSAPRNAASLAEEYYHAPKALLGMQLLAALAAGPPAAREAVVAANALGAVVDLLRKKDVNYTMRSGLNELRTAGLELLTTLAVASEEQARAVVATECVKATVAVLKANQYDRGLAEAGCGLLTALLDSRALSPAAALSGGALAALAAALRSWAFVEAPVVGVSASLRRVAVASPADAALVVGAGALPALLHAAKANTDNAVAAGAALGAAAELVKCAPREGKPALAAVEGGGACLVAALAAHTGVTEVAAPACTLLVTALARNGGSVGGNGGGGAGAASAAAVPADAMRLLAAALSAHAGVGAVAEPAAQALLALCGVPRDAATAQRVAEAGVPGAVVTALRAGALPALLQSVWTARLKEWVGAWPALAAGVARAGGLEGLL